MKYSKGYFFRKKVYQVLLAQQERHQGKFLIKIDFLRNR